MKDHFFNLFRYDRYANLQILEAIFEAGKPQNAVKLMAHLLGAPQIWLSRCIEIQLPGSSIWPNWQAVQFKYIIEENHVAWHNFLATLNNENISRGVTYNNSKGEQFQNSLVNILTHVVNHGTHHRAQIGLILKQAGLENLQSTDYVFYIREQNS